jgi:recombination protein RecA
MVERVKQRVVNGGNYFGRPHTGVEFISSGSKLLDLALGGGWAEGRISNIIGDKSTGKTLLCIEQCANFAMKHSRGNIYYRESEAAFDKEYAAALGLPVDRVDFGEKELLTVEDMFEDLTEIIKRSRQPTLYICDSLDALSDRAERDREIDKGSFGAAKAKKMSELFRRLVQSLARKNVTTQIVSQVRDKIGVMFGEKYSRTGGRALDFYSSQTIMLTQIEKLTDKIGNAKRVVGIEVRAQVKKNKVGLPWRQAQFPIVFGYGIDDDRAAANWLKTEGGEKDIPSNPKVLRALLEKRWYEVERSFLPKKSKYGDPVREEVE